MFLPIFIYADNQDFKMHYKKATIFLKNKEYKNAITEYKNAIQLNPKFKEGYLKIGICYDQYLRDYNNAIEYYMNYIQLCGEKSSEIRKIVKNIVNLKYETSNKEFEEIKKAVDIYNKGINYGKKGDLKKAVEYFKKSINIIPYYLKSNYALGLTYFNLGDYENSYKFLLYAVNVDPDNDEITEAYLKLALISDDLYLKDYELAKRYYQKYIKKNGKNIMQAQQLLDLIEELDKLILEAQQLFMNKRYDEAENKLKEALGIKPFDIRVMNNLGIIYIQEKRYKDAIEQFTNALKIREDFGDAYYNLACVYSKMGDIDMGLKYLQMGKQYFSQDLIEQSKKDNDLKNLRENNDFRKIMGE